MSNYTNQKEIDINIKQGGTILYKSIFNPYVHIIKNSEKKEREINKKSEDDLTENTLKIKKLLEEEEKKISHSELSSYDPTEFNNNLQFLRLERKSILEKKEEEIKELRSETNIKLIEVMDKGESTGLFSNSNKNRSITEQSKIIQCYGTSKSFCKVIFTLVPIEKFDCKPGDIIKFEWYDCNNKLRIESKRFGKGINGIKIPHMYTSELAHQEFKFNLYKDRDSAKRRTWDKWFENNKLDF